MRDQPGTAGIYNRAAVKNGRVMISGAEDIADARSRPEIAQAV